jgi:hypothetical protein
MILLPGGGFLFEMTRTPFGISINVILTGQDFCSHKTDEHVETEAKQDRTSIDVHKRVSNQLSAEDSNKHNW